MTAVPTFGVPSASAAAGVDWVSQRGQGGARRAEDTSSGTQLAPAARQPWPPAVGHCSPSPYTAKIQTGPANSRCRPNCSRKSSPPSNHESTAIDIQGLPGHVSGCRAEQEQDRADHILWLCDAAQGNELTIALRVQSCGGIFVRAPCAAA